MHAHAKALMIRVETLVLLKYIGSVFSQLERMSVGLETLESAFEAMSSTLSSSVSFLMGYSTDIWQQRDAFQLFAERLALVTTNQVWLRVALLCDPQHRLLFNVVCV